MPDSPASMINVWLSAITLLGLFGKMVFDFYTAAARRKWEVEDRSYKDNLKLKTEQTVRAANASCVKIQESMAQRTEQIGTVLTAVQATSAIAQASANASREALDVANGHNAKILEATKIANESLEIAKSNQPTTRLQ
jgi:hypothetical protein